MMHTHSKGVNAVRKSDLSYEDLETKIELQDSKLEYQDQYHRTATTHDSRPKTQSFWR